jgi:hypothetical protein
MYILLTPANNPHSEGFAVLEDRWKIDKQYKSRPLPMKPEN